MSTRTATARAAAAASALVGALAATATPAGATPQAPSPVGSCVATVTVAEAGIAPGFVGDEVKGIVALGPDALPSLVRSLAAAHLGDPEACAVLAGE